MATTQFINSINQSVIITDATTITAIPNSTYYCEASSGVTITLPSPVDATVSYTIMVMQAGSSIVTINYTTGQQIRVGPELSTASTGYIATTSTGDAITLFTPDGEFFQAANYIGAITVA